MYCREREVLVSRCWRRLVICLKKPSCTVGEAGEAVEVLDFLVEAVVEEEWALTDAEDEALTSGEEDADSVSFV